MSLLKVARSARTGHAQIAAAAQVESARKLRWYDREDLKPLVEATLKDKQLLQETIAALRQATPLLLMDHILDRTYHQDSSPCKPVLSNSMGMHQT